MHMRIVVGKIQQRRFEAQRKNIIFIMRMKASNLRTLLQRKERMQEEKEKENKKRLIFDIFLSAIWYEHVKKNIEELLLKTLT